MDRVEFVSSAGLIEPVINGVLLKKLVKSAELRFAVAEGDESLAGSYVGLARAVVGHPGDHYKGRPTLSWFDDGDAVLLGCGCGEWGCWPLTACIKYGARTVAWSRFRNGHRDEWDLSNLGPYEFDRHDYDLAVDSLTP